MRTPTDEYIHIHLPCDGTQAIQVPGRYTLVSVYDSYTNWGVCHCRAQREV